MANFRFDEENHLYFLGAERLLSPSSVFQELGLVDDRWYKPEHRQRGKAVHAAIHYALKGTLDWDTLDPDLHGYVASGLKYVAHRRPKILRFETVLHHPALKFAGTFDVEWQIAGDNWIIDWKTGKAAKVTRYQTAAYEILARYQAQPCFYKRAAIELQADGSMPNVVPYQDSTDGAAWLAMLATARIRRSLNVPALAPILQGE